MSYSAEDAWLWGFNDSGPLQLWEVGANIGNCGLAAAAILRARPESERFF